MPWLSSISSAILHPFQCFSLRSSMPVPSRDPNFGPLWRRRTGLNWTAAQTRDSNSGRSPGKAFFRDHTALSRAETETLLSTERMTSSAQFSFLCRPLLAYCLYVFPGLRLTPHSFPDGLGWFAIPSRFSRHRQAESTLQQVYPQHFLNLHGRVPALSPVVKGFDSISPFHSGMILFMVTRNDSCLVILFCRHIRYR